LNVKGSWLIFFLPVYALPLPVIFSLSFSRGQIVGLAGAFLIGFLCVFFAAANVAATFLSASINVCWMFTIFEQTNAVIVACLPALQSLARFGRKAGTTVRSKYSQGSRVRASTSERGVLSSHSEDAKSMEMAKNEIHVGVDVEVGVIELGSRAGTPSEPVNSISTKVTSWQM
jgi:hypothetical protein